MWICGGRKAEKTLLAGWKTGDLTWRPDSEQGAVPKPSNGQKQVVQAKRLAPPRGDPAAAAPPLPRCRPHASQKERGLKLGRAAPCQKCEGLELNPAKWWGLPWGPMAGPGKDHQP